MPNYAMRPWPKQKTRDLTGQRFGLVQVLRMAPSTGQGTRCFVRCDCGVERYVLSLNLRREPPATHLGCKRAQNAEARE